MSVRIATKSSPGRPALVATTAPTPIRDQFVQEHRAHADQVAPRTFDRDPEERERIDHLWADYWANGDLEIRAELIVLHLHLVDIVIRRLPSNLLGHWSLDDLRSYGYIGLINAVDRRRSDLAHIPFAPYALCRIRGAIYDELRGLDWLPRTLRRRVIEFRETEDMLRASLRHRPSRQEVYREMALTDRRKVMATTLAMQRAQFVSLQDPVGDSDEIVIEDSLNSSDDPEAAIIAQSGHEELEQALDRLPLRQRTIIDYRFSESLTQHQVGDLIGVSSTRVAQLERQALRELRHLLGVRKFQIPNARVQQDLARRRAFSQTGTLSS